MAERDRQLDRERTVDDADMNLDGLGDESGGFEATAEPTERQSNQDTGVRSRARETVGSVASVRSLLVAFAVVTAGALVLGGFLPLGSLGNLLGIALGAFAYGVASGTRHYMESTVAGTAVGGVLAFLGNVILSLTGIGLPLVAVGAIGGGVAGLVGHYFGRDLRKGLTKDI